MDRISTMMIQLTKGNVNQENWVSEQSSEAADVVIRVTFNLSNF